MAHGYFNTICEGEEEEMASWHEMVCQERRINLDKLNQNDPWVTVVWIPSLDGLGKMEVLTMLASQYLE